MSGRRAIEPLDGPLDAVVRVPGSKSITNRALMCAALAEGRSRLCGVLDADDTSAMAEGLAALGVAIGRQDDVAVVDGVGGRFTVPEGTRLDARLSGTTSRFLLPAAVLASAPVVIDGGAPLRARPMADGIGALADLGMRLESADGHLPVTVWPATEGGGDRPSTVTVSGEASSQFVSGLLLVAPCLADGLEIRVDGVVRSAPYLDLTVAVMRAFGARVEVASDRRWFLVEPTGYRAVDYDVEPDASAASYFFAAAALCGGSVTVEGLGSASLQGDVAFVDVLADMGVEVERDSHRTTVRSDGRLRGVTVDMADISDTAQTLAAIAPFAEGGTTIEGIGFIRAKETDRIAAMVTELRRCGIDATELPDGIHIESGVPGPALIRTYDDHRMAMSFAVLGLRSPGIVIDDPGCVAKTFPGFWDTLDAVRGRRQRSST